MSDNIKTRLRSASLALPGACSDIAGEPVNLNICTEAAGYIEKLERELAAKDERIAELSDQLDDERVRLAACGVAAMANTRASMTERITKSNPFYSGSYEEVCKAVDKQVAYREQLDEARKDAERYRWLRSIGHEQLNVMAHYAEQEMDKQIDAAMKDKP